MTRAEIEALGVAKEVAANKRMKAPGFVGNAAAYERDANRRSREAGFKNAADQEIDANRRARRAGFKNAALKENPAAAAPGESIYSTKPFIDPRTPGTSTQFSYPQTSQTSYNPGSGLLSTSANIIADQKKALEMMRIKNRIPILDSSNDGRPRKASNMMQLPQQLGKTKLAYITDSERKLLRRRDAVSGKKAPEYSKEGVPVLDPEGGGAERQWEEQQERESKLKRQQKAAGWKSVHVGGGETVWQAPKVVAKPKLATTVVKPKTKVNVQASGGGSNVSYVKPKSKVKVNTSSSKSAAPQVNKSHSTYVQNNPDLLAHYNAKIKNSGKSMAQWGAEHWQKFGKNENRKNAPSTSASSTGSASNLALTKTHETKHSKKHKYKKQYTDMASKAKDYNKYVDSYGDLSNAYKEILNNPNSAQAQYWRPRMANMSKEAFGKAHAGESMALQSGTYRGATKAMGSKARAIPNRVAATTTTTTAPTTTTPTVTQPTSGGGGGGGGGGDSTSTLNIDPTQGGNAPIVAPLIDAVVIEGAESEIVQERVKDLINTNSPLFKAATTKALQSMNASGLANSSMAQEAVMSAILAVAIPIASADAQTFTAQRMANQNASNAFKAQQNAAYYEAFVTRLNGQIQQTLQQLTNKAANWRAVLAERGRIAVTAGMSKEAAENALKTVTPTWF